MSTGSSTSTGPKNFVFKEPSKHLRRGKACLNCRFYKIKCDGAKPICGPCTRNPRDDDCEYSDGPSTTKQLEQNVTRLQARLQELERKRASSSSLTISQSFVSSSTPSSSPGGYGVSPGLTPPLSDEDDDYDNPFLDTPEPPRQCIEILLQNFLPRSSQFGFFLQTDSFYSSALLSRPFGDRSRPTPALLCSVYLWGVHLSGDEAVLAHEPIFLRRVLRQISLEISTVLDSGKIMHTIQALILLAFYFLRTSQFVEAEFHTSGAISLCVSAGLHKIRSSRPFSPPVLGVMGRAEIFLPAPGNALEEAERINGFWTVFCLKKVIDVCLGNVSEAFGGLDNPAGSVDTPWPVDLNESKSGRVSPSYSSCTMNHFLTDTSQRLVTSSSIAAYTKAAILLHRAVCLHQKLNSGLSTQEFETFTNECMAIDHLITQFHSSLPSLSGLSSSSSSSQDRLVVTYTMTSCAYLKIQSIFANCGIAEAKQRYMSTAQTILRNLNNIPRLSPGMQQQVPQSGFSPILGALCSMACKTFLDEMKQIGEYRNATGWGQQNLGMIPGQTIDSVFVGHPLPSEQLPMLRSAFNGGLSTMGVLARDCPLAKYLLGKLQEAARGWA